MFKDEHPPRTEPYSTGSAKYSFYFNSSGGSGTASPQVTVTFLELIPLVKFPQTLKDTQPTAGEAFQRAELKPCSKQFQQAQSSLKNNTNLYFLQLIIVFLTNALLEATVLEGSSQSAREPDFEPYFLISDYQNTQM